MCNPLINESWGSKVKRFKRIDDVKKSGMHFSFGGQFLTANKIDY